MSTAFDLLENVKSGQRVFIQGGAATPTILISALLEHAARLRNVEIIHIHTIDSARYAEEKYKESFRVANLFLGSNMRDKIQNENVGYLPCFLSEIPSLFRSGVRPLDVALIHVSKPDRHGFCSLGTSVDVTRSAVDNAKVIIAQVNARMPRVHGDGFIHIDRIHHTVEVDQELPESPRPSLSKSELAIGQYASEIIEDGATLQVGIGNIPDAVLNFLKDRRHLGLHTEMWSDGALELIKSGVVDNSRKKVYAGRSVSGFVIGSRELYSYVDDNPAVIQLDIEYVNNPSIISRNPKVTAINSAVEIDLTGQVCADSIGSRIISGVGGQMDFMRGAAMSEGGRSIIAVSSRTRKGISRIVPRLRPGAGVVTTRAHVHHVVTEYGRVDLFGKTLKERAQALIGVAHPEDREYLERQWIEMSR
ncbi:acetyl-CoA hydrolase/transferase family protein [Bdellovibrio sp. BCCA]|uniref:acetyl-CoA hydrolase/transferase family protein n=1 Tax=Bdellovibrio sp. BCCA TaxID=3136281 RepID=UPI0030F1CE55